MHHIKEYELFTSTAELWFPAGFKILSAGIEGDVPYLSVLIPDDVPVSKCVQIELHRTGSDIRNAHRLEFINAVETSNGVRWYVFRRPA